MSCRKYTLTNTGSTIINFNYRRCDDQMWEYQIELEPNQTKNIWFIDGTFSIAQLFINSVIIEDDGLFPYAVSPTPTPSVTPTPSPTPGLSQTPTPTNTPTISATPTITPSPTPGLSQTPTPTNTPTITNTPTLTQTNTPTPTITNTPSPTPSPGYFAFSLKYDVVGWTEACATGATATYYSNSNSLNTLSILATDTLLTLPAPDGYYCVGSCPNAVGKDWIQVGGGGGQIQGTSTC